MDIALTADVREKYLGVIVKVRQTRVLFATTDKNSCYLKMIRKVKSSPLSIGSMKDAHETKQEV